MRGMRHVILLLLVAAVSLAGADPPLRQRGGGWKGIVPLHSGRVEVERLLGASPDECRCIYHTEAETIYVEYAKAPCKGPANGWNVAPDTVLELSVASRIKPTFSELGLDPGEFVKTSDSPGTTYYTSLQKGIRYAVQRGSLMSVAYIPSAADAPLRCAGFPAYDGGVTAYRPYAQFRRVSDAETFARLDDFAIQLIDETTFDGYVVAYAGRVSKKGEARMMAEQAKRYLIDKRNLPAARIKSINGGYREEAEYELYLIRHTLPPPTPTPTLPPGEVRVSGQRRAKGGAAIPRRP